MSEPSRHWLSADAASRSRAFIFIVVGLKMLWLNEVFDGKFPISWSLGIIGVLLCGSIVASLLWPIRHAGKATDERGDRR